MTLRRVLVTCLVLAGCASPAAVPGDPSTEEPVPAGLLEGSRAVVPFHPAVLRARQTDGLAAPVTDAADPFDDARAPRTLRLNLFADAVFDARLVAVHREGDGLRWRGEVMGHAGSEVTLAFRGAAVSGTVRVDDRLFTIAPRAAGPMVVEWDEAAAPSDAPSVPAAADGVPDRPGRRGTRGPAARADGGDAQIDLLVVYTGEAAAVAGGPDAIAATIDVAIEEANAALADSGVSAHFSLLEARETAYDETDFDFGQTLGRLATPGDGYLDDAVASREALGADHVVLIVDHAGPYAGIGFQMTGANAPGFDRFAYSVVSRDYAAGFYTFAHELGHNLGADHDPAHAAGGYRADSHGHQVPEAGYRTIMAYSCEGTYCARRGRWSSPERTYEGAPTGVAGVADNAATLRETTAIAAGFRERPTPPPAPASRIVAPEDGATLPEGEVTFRWEDVGADAYVLSVGSAPGDEAYARVEAGAATSARVAGLPQTGETLHVRLWTLSGGAWQARDHSYVAAAPPTFEGARLALPEAALSSSWHWFAWEPVEGARGYRLEVGTADDPDAVIDVSTEATEALVVGLPVDGRAMRVRLSTLGPSGWVTTETAHKAWQAPDYAAVLVSPAHGGQLTGGTQAFTWTDTPSPWTWLFVQDAAGQLLGVTVGFGSVATMSGLPTDGRTLYSVLYTTGDEGWVATTARLTAAGSGR